MDDLRVCLLGDSYTLGQGDDTGLGWPGRVFAAARAAGHILTFYNLGVRGDTGSQIAARAKAESDARFRNGDRKAVIISFGANDLTQSRLLEESLEAFEALLDWAKAEGHAVFVILPPVYLESTRAVMAAAMSAAMANICEQSQVPFLDVRSVGVNWALWWTQARAGDGTHPGAEAYASLAAAFIRWPAWQVWLTGLS